MELTPEVIDRVLELCVGEMGEDELVAIQNKLEAMLPEKVMAADASLKRRIRIGVDYHFNGRDSSVRKSAAAASMAMDMTAIEKEYPNFNRLIGSSRIMRAIPMPHKPGKAMTTAERAEAEAAFPNLFRRH